MQIRGTLRRILRRLRGDERGLVAIEFAFVVPVVILMVLATAEIGRFILLQTKLENSTANVADLITRPEELSSGDIDRVFSAVSTMLSPFDAGSQVRVIVSGVIRPSDQDPPEVAWQHAGGGSLGASSAVGAPGQPANVPSDLTVAGGDAVIVTELYYEYESWGLGIAGDQELSHRAFFRPRRGSLTSLN